MMFLLKAAISIPVTMETDNFPQNVITSIKATSVSAKILSRISLLSHQYKSDPVFALGSPFGLFSESHGEKPVRIKNSANEGQR